MTPPYTSKVPHPIWIRHKTSSSYSAKHPRPKSIGTNQPVSRLARRKKHGIGAKMLASDGSQKVKAPATLESKLVSIYLPKQILIK
jgi:hypothetical protein